MTRLLLDENFPHGAVRGLEQAGHDVRSVAGQAPGLDDAGVLTLVCGFGRRFEALSFKLTAFNRPTDPRSPP